MQFPRMDISEMRLSSSSTPASIIAMDIIQYSPGIKNVQH